MDENPLPIEVISFFESGHKDPYLWNCKRCGASVRAGKRQLHYDWHGKVDTNNMTGVSDDSSSNPDR